ncbi:MAG: prepilin-type N-terminal cleavage/methylation domain-containing protein [Opitutaceae bacterium]
MTIRSKKGFTLVEIMIVVVIIGLLAAMAIPAFMKVRRSSTKSTMANDIKQIAGGCNSYFLEQGVSQVATDVIINVANDTTAGFLKSLSKGVTTTDTTWTMGATSIITLNHPNFGTLTGSVDTGKTLGETVTQ